MATTKVTELLPVTNGVLVLDADAVPGPVFADQLERLTNGAPIVVRDAVRTVEGDMVRVTGKASLLGVPDMNTTATAAPGPDGPVVTVRFNLIDETTGPNYWSFSKSFPDLPPFYSGLKVSKAPSGGAPPEPANLLDRLVLSDAAYVITTAESGADAVTGGAITAGLNFVALCAPTGLVGMLGSVMPGGGPVRLSGPVVVPTPTQRTPPFEPMADVRFPWQLPAPVPGIHLLADLGIDETLGGALRFHDVGLRIYSPTSQAWADANPTYWPIFTVVGTLEVPSAEISLEIAASNPSSTGLLTLFGIFEGVTVGKLAQLFDLAGGDDLAGYLPDDVQGALDTLDSLSLESIMLQLGAGLKVHAVAMSVGMRDLDTGVLPGFTVRRLRTTFNVADPFGKGRGLTVNLGGGFEFLGAPFDVDVAFPEVAGMARLAESVTVSLDTLFDELGLPAPPTLDIAELRLGVATDGSYSVAAVMAEDPPWTLDLGPVPLTVANVRLLAAHPVKSPATGSLSGLLRPGDAFEFAFAYDTPGDFILRAELPDVKLLDLVRGLTDRPVALPPGFDLEFTDGYVLIQEAGPNLTFQFATTMESLGTVAFEARRVGAGAGGWGFAAGIDLTVPRLSALPGLDTLAPFEAMFRLDQVVLVAASFDDPAFTFPSLAAFNAPTLRTGNLKLPAQAGGVIAGLNAYARWTIDTTSREQKLLRDFLGLEATIGITLQVAADPKQDSWLYASVDTKVQGLALSCQFGGRMRDGKVSLFLTGVLVAEIQKRPVRFDVTLLYVANGAFLSGSMNGTIEFEGLTLSNVALVVGISWEGIPSLGIAASLAVDHFDSSVAIFFDSADPSRSMLAGAVSGLTLKDVLDTFAGDVAPSDVDDVLSHIGLVGTDAFTLDAALADALDNRGLEEIAAAFAPHGIQLPTASSQVVLAVGKKGEHWFLTDMTTMLHYELEKVEDGIRVTLEPQLYVVPQTTAIGGLVFQQGTFLNAALDILAFHAEAKILVKPSRGILADGTVDRVVIGNEALFVIESMDGKRGPRLSIATAGRPEDEDPRLHRPHALIDGRMNLLGLEQSAYFEVSTTSIAFAIDGEIRPGFDYALRGSIGGPTQLGAGGTLNVGVGAIDLGPLGTVDIGTGVTGTLDVGVAGDVSHATFAGGFRYAGREYALPGVDLDVRTAALLSLPEELATLVARELEKLFADAALWAKYVHDGLVAGVEDVGKVLAAVYGASMDQAAQWMKAAGYGVDEIGNALRSGWNASAEAVGSALKGAGYAVDEVGDFLEDAYDLSPKKLSKTLKKAGFSNKKIEKYFKDLGGEFKKYAKKMDPTKW
ncbi:MAG TPA: hypothetical protein VF188_17115 [Longimicrobiales bacterium]